MLGKAHSEQVELQILQCTALALATAPSMNTCSFIYCSSGNWQPPSLCCQATKKVPASGSKQTNQATQRRRFTWLDSKMERKFSGSPQDHGCWNQHQSRRELRKSETSLFGWLRGGLVGWEWRLQGYIATQRWTPGGHIRLDPQAGVPSMLLHCHHFSTHVWGTVYVSGSAWWCRG